MKSLSFNEIVTCIYRFVNSGEKFREILILPLILTLSLCYDENTALDGEVAVPCNP